MNNLTHHVGIAAAITTLMTVCTAAQAATTLPAAQTFGAVTYLSGGIGKSESSAIERASANWPLTLEFAVKDGTRSDFVADVKAIIRDANGNIVMRTDSSGPFILAKLAPGHYMVDATLQGKTLKRMIDVEKKHTVKAVLVWPSGTDEGTS